VKLPNARTEKLTIRELPEETLVYDLERNKSHCLNRTASLVWQHCDGQTTVAEMAAILHNELDLPADQHLVRLALEQLSRRQLLQTPVAPLSGKARMTRRDALKKIAVAAAALPIVMTLTAKTARVNASTHAPAQVCPAGKCNSDRDCLALLDSTKTACFNQTSSVGCTGTCGPEPAPNHNQTFVLDA